MSYTSLHYHIVFSTKARKPLLKPDILPRLTSYLGGIAREKQGRLIAANGSTDHIHLVVNLHPKTALADFIRTLKTNTSRWIHQTFPDMLDFAWQDGYSAFTISYSGLSQVIRYVEEQQEHHKKLSFQEELIALLKRHKIEYDERYISG